jgi:hypothetical protein
MKLTLWLKLVSFMKTVYKKCFFFILTRSSPLCIITIGTEKYSLAQQCIFKLMKPGYIKNDYRVNKFSSTPNLLLLLIMLSIGKLPKLKTYKQQFWSKVYELHLKNMVPFLHEFSCQRTITETVVVKCTILITFPIILALSDHKFICFVF